jgi:uncharacterized protein
MGTRSCGRCGCAGARVALTVLLLGATGPWPPGASAADAEPPREPLAHFPEADLAVATDGASHRFRVWVADTEPRREQGLMYVRALKPDRGMLFVFDGPQVASFWMKNTLIPLDILFVSPDGRVIRIAASTTPLSLAPIGSMGVVRSVLELRGGTAQRLGIRPGARLSSAALPHPN